MTPVYVLVFDGVDELTFVGPYDVLSACKKIEDGKLTEKKAFRVELVAERVAPVTCAHGLRVLPDKTLAQADSAKVVIVPGGPGARKERQSGDLLEWLRRNNDTAQVVCSISTGAFLLGRAGLLTGRTLGTHHACCDEFMKHFPKANLDKSKKVVTDGRNLLSCPGITQGIEGALHIIERFEGRESAQKAAERVGWEGY